MTLSFYMVAPHLPSPSSNIGSHRRLERIKLILIVTLIGVWAGGAGAFIVLGWLWPVAGEADTWAISYSYIKSGREELADAIREEVRTRIVTVYSGQTSFEGGSEFLSVAQRVGKGMVLSADGWIGVYAPQGKTETTSTWKVLMSDGKVMTVARTIKDQATNMVYLKVTEATSTFWRPIEFGRDSKVHDEVFILTDTHTWQPATIERTNYSVPVAGGHSDAEPILRWIVSEPVPQGALILSKQGRVVGIGAGEKIVIPSTLISQQLFSLLTKQTLHYASLGIEGWFSEEQPLVINHQVVPGFLITKVLTPRSSFHKGDIIVAINNQIVEPDKMWYTIQANKEVHIRLWRTGKIVELTAPISSL